MGPLDLVGVAEAAEILGKPASRVKRWQASGKMPATIAEPRATPVWHRADVEALRDGATAFPEREKLPLIGFAEVAEIENVDRTTVRRWRRAGTFPPHIPSSEEGATPEDPTLRAGPLWMRDVIVADAERRATERAAA